MCESEITQWSVFMLQLQTNRHSLQKLLTNMKRSPQIQQQRDEYVTRPEYEIGSDLDPDHSAQNAQNATYMQHEKPESTLTEPVVETLRRDINSIITKLRYAVIPTSTEDKQRKHAKQLQKWDLWGPFALCLLLSTTLALRTHESEQTIITSVFVIMWFGSLAVWLNAYFLGSNMSFFQSASLLGYCLFPLNIVSFLTWIVGSWMPPFIKLILVVLSLVWSSKSAMGFMSEMVPQRKKKLALYPISLFYLFLSWFVLIV